MTYINFLELVDKIGIDYNTDTYDAGLHMNLSGAEKLSAYWGQVLQEQFRVPDRRDNETLADIWADNIAAYDAERQAQYAYYSTVVP